MSLCFVILFKNGFTQTSRLKPEDTEGWYSTAIQLDLPKKWKIGFDYQLRFYNNLQAYKGSYFSIGPEKKIFRNIYTFFEYRLALVNKGNYHRYSLGTEYKSKILKLHINVRGIIQNQLQDFDEKDKLNGNDLYWRVRFKLQYPLTNKIDLYASIEPVMKTGADYFIDNWRNEAGLKIEIAKSTVIEPFYIYRPDYAKAYNRVFNILGLNISYNIKTKKGVKEYL